MKKKALRSFMWLLLFGVWTALVCTVDVCAIGPRGSTEGLATINQFVHNLTNVHFTLYHITDWLGLVPIAFALGFALLGLVQWIKRKHLARVDYTLFVLGGFYVLVIAAYVLFEAVVINYRPVLIHGFLEASYPSSTTLLTLCVMPTAVSQLRSRISNTLLRNVLTLLLTAFTVFMVVGRLLSGVHWITDIIGGTLLSAGLVSAYHAAVNSRKI